MHSAVTSTENHSWIFCLEIHRQQLKWLKSQQKYFQLETLNKFPVDTVTI